MKLPITLGLSIDKVCRLKIDVDLAKKALEKSPAYKTVVKAERLLSEGTDLLMDTFGAEKLNQAAGRQGIAVITYSDRYQITDSGAFYGYVEEHKASDLLQRRINASAVKERNANGEDIPGLAKYEVVKLTVKELS